MNNSVVAIGLDAAEPWLMEAWMDAGHLPNMSSLREQGSYCRLENIEHYRAETPWTSFVTGCRPEKTGYWSPIRYHGSTGEPELIEAYDYEEHKPFYALGDDHRVAIFDIPQVKVCDNVNGVQMLAWGSHSPMGPSESKPASLFQEIVDAHGVHPGFDDDHATIIDLEDIERLRQQLESGIGRRSTACQDLLSREPWDLFLTIFSEPHSAGHFMWHLSQDNHPLYETLGKQSDDKMLSVFKAVDKAVGEILAKAPKDAYKVVFSAHGMDTNVMDLPSNLFLPEFLYRINFPGRYGLAKGTMGAALEPAVHHYQRDNWLWDVWLRKHDTNPLLGVLRQRLSHRYMRRLEPLLANAEVDLTSPFKLYEHYRNYLAWQPPVWYKSCWHQMKAFALPSFSEGYIRINLKDRDIHGIVDAADYDAVCNEVIEQLQTMVDARTQTPMVQKVMRTRTTGYETDPKLPDADIVVMWQEQYATDTVESSLVGRIGPFPYLRSGSHRNRGFMLAQGAGIAPGSTLPESSSFDLAPTILQLMGAPIPAHLDGTPLIKAPTMVGV